MLSLTVGWVEQDPAEFIATEDSIVRRSGGAALISSVRPRWGYIALLPLDLGAKTDEIEICLTVHAGEVSVALASDDGAVLMFEQSVPVGWRGSLYLPVVARGTPMDVIVRSTSPAGAPAVVSVHSIKMRLTS